MTTRPPTHVGRLGAIRRYPVKSLVGEELDLVSVDDRGVVGDRLWCVRDADGKLGSGKSTRRFRKMEGLLSLAAQYDDDVPVIDFGGGRQRRGDDDAVHQALRTLVGRPVRLSREEDVSHFDEGPIHLVTTATLRRLEEARGQGVDDRRLRPNFVIDTGDRVGFVEDAWIGRELALGDEVVLAVREPMPRCVMLNLAQRDLPEDADLLRTATRLNDAQVGVVADVVTAGQVRVGDEARLLP
jgi:hypothetical protein